MKVKVKSSMEYLLPLFVESISTTCDNATEVAQLAAKSCSRPNPATGNGVREARSNRLVVIPTIYMAAPSERYLRGANAGHKSQV